MACRRVPHDLRRCVVERMTAAIIMRSQNTNIHRAWFVLCGCTMWVWVYYVIGCPAFKRHCAAAQQSPGITPGIGVGVLALPSAFAALGWVAGCISLIGVGVIIFMCTMLFSCAHIVKGKRNKTYHEAVECVMGPRHAIIATIVQLAFIFSMGMQCVACMHVPTISHVSTPSPDLAYIITPAISLQTIEASLLPAGSTPHRPWFWALVVGAAQLILSQIPSLEASWMGSVAGTVLSITYCCIAVYLGISNWSWSGTLGGISTTPLDKTFGVFNALGIIAFAVCGRGCMLCSNGECAFTFHTSHTVFVKQPAHGHCGDHQGPCQKGHTKHYLPQQQRVCDPLLGRRHLQLWRPGQLGPWQRTDQLWKQGTHVAHSLCKLCSSLSPVARVSSLCPSIFPQHVHGQESPRPQGARGQLAGMEGAPGAAQRVRTAAHRVGRSLSFFQLCLCLVRLYSMYAFWCLCANTCTLSCFTRVAHSSSSHSFPIGSILSGYDVDQAAQTELGSQDVAAQCQRAGVFDEPVCAVRVPVHPGAICEHVSNWRQ